MKELDNAEFEFMDIKPAWTDIRPLIEILERTCTNGSGGNQLIESFGGTLNIGLANAVLIAILHCAQRNRAVALELLHRFLARCRFRTHPLIHNTFLPAHRNALERWREDGNSLSSVEMDGVILTLEVALLAAQEAVSSGLGALEEIEQADWLCEFLQSERGLAPDALSWYQRHLKRVRRMTH